MPEINNKLHQGIQLLSLLLVTCTERATHLKRYQKAPTETERFIDDVVVVVIFFDIDLKTFLLPMEPRREDEFEFTDDAFDPVI